MQTSEQDLFDEKINLIYEFNKRSPLFVRKADLEIKSNNLENAIEILQNGLQIFPESPTAYIILGRVLMLTGEYSAAKEAFKKGCDLINSNESYAYYFAEVEKFKKQRIPFENGRFSTLNSDIAPFDFEENYSSQKKYLNKNRAFEDSLPDLAKKIQGAKIPGVDAQLNSNWNKNNLENLPEKMIVSETLAKIYFSQGGFKEAIFVYEELKKINPHKKDFYAEKIDEINRLIKPV